MYFSFDFSDELSAQDGGCISHSTSLMNFFVETAGNSAQPDKISYLQNRWPERRFESLPGLNLCHETDVWLVFAYNKQNSLAAIQNMVCSFLSSTLQFSACL